MRGILRKKGNIWVWAAVGLIAGPWALGAARNVVGGVGIPKVSGGNGG